jgi:ubiquinone/menaquinone biosynthesis C-methylase UbiE
MPRTIPSSVRALDRRLYPGFQDNWDDELLRKAILARLRPGSRALDLGAGAGIVSQMNFRGLGATICGVDLEPRVAANPYLDEAMVAGAEAIPYPDESFDLVFCDNVLEHLPDPEAAFREIHRILKPGGVFLFKTPNRFHYMPLIASLTPTCFHRMYNRMRGREGADTFPTKYRANSRGAILRLASETGLEVESLERIEGRPEYLRLSAPTYLVGALYERIVNRFEVLALLRILLLGSLRRPLA